MMRFQFLGRIATTTLPLEISEYQVSSIVSSNSLCSYRIPLSYYTFEIQILLLEISLCFVGYLCSRHLLREQSNEFIKMCILLFLMAFVSTFFIQSLMGKFHFDVFYARISAPSAPSLRFFGYYSLKII